MWKVFYWHTKFFLSFLSSSLSLISLKTKELITESLWRRWWKEHVELGPVWIGFQSNTQNRLWYNRVFALNQYKKGLLSIYLIVVMCWASSNLFLHNYSFRNLNLFNHSEWIYFSLLSLGFLHTLSSTTTSVLYNRIWILGFIRNNSIRIFLFE